MEISRNKAALGRITKTHRSIIELFLVAIVLREAHDVFILVYCAHYWFTLFFILV